MIEAGCSTYETVREWETRFAPVLAEQLRTKRRGQAGQSWYVDETYVKVKGKWCYLSRAIDADGNLVDSRLSEKRDMEGIVNLMDLQSYDLQIEDKSGEENHIFSQKRGNRKAERCVRGENSSREKFKLTIPDHTTIYVRRFGVGEISLEGR